MKQRRGLGCILLVVLGGMWALPGGAASRAFAQDKKSAWEILVAYDPADKNPAKKERIALRPNVLQPVFLYLRNPGADEDTTIEVQLLRLLKPVAKAKMDNLDFSKPQLVMFELLAEPAKKDPGAPAPPPANEGPPFDFQLRVIEKGKKPALLSLPVEIEQPQAYMKTASAHFNKNADRLSVSLEVKADRAEPPCPVEVVVNPEILPRLLIPVRGNTGDQLNSTSPGVTLDANLQFLDAPPKHGRVYVTVDKYERAFMFKFDQGELRLLEQRPDRVRLKVPRYFNPSAVDKGPKGEDKGPPKLPVHIEADGTGTDKWIELALDRGGEGRRYVRKALLPGLRQQTIAVGPAPEGGLLFKTMVRDWKLELDVLDVLGQPRLRVQVLDRDKRTPLPLADEQNYEDEAMFLFSADPQQYAPLTYVPEKNNNAVYAKITLDTTEPEGVRFVDLPKKVSPDEKVRLKATAKQRDPAAQAPISKVQFLLGAPPKEPAIEAIFDAKVEVWRADLIVPADAKDKLAITAVFTTATGVSALPHTELIKVQAADQENSKITGVVSWDGKIQAGNGVTLRDAKGKELAKTKADAKGVYVFLNVQPGTYRVTAGAAGMLQGITPAKVTKEKGEIVKADISLKRVP